jgi:hypothetical protein
MALIMDIITPLVQHLVPKDITKFSERNDYMKENFIRLFMNEYWFHPSFKVNGQTVEIEVIEDSIFPDGFETLPAIINKIKERTKGFKVNIHFDIHILLWDC